MFIDNKANLDLEVIARKIKSFLKSHKEFEEEIVVFKYGKSEYKITFKQNKTSFKATVEKLFIYPNEISKKGLNFPKISRK